MKQARLKLRSEKKPRVIIDQWDIENEYAARLFKADPERYPGFCQLFAERVIERIEKENACPIPPPPSRRIAR